MLLRLSTTRTLKTSQVPDYQQCFGDRSQHGCHPRRAAFPGAASHHPGDAVQFCISRPMGGQQKCDLYWATPGSQPIKHVSSSCAPKHAKTGYIHRVQSITFSVNFSPNLAAVTDEFSLEHSHPFSGDRGFLMP